MAAVGDGGDEDCGEVAGVDEAWELSGDFVPGGVQHAIHVHYDASLDVIAAVAVDEMAVADAAVKAAVAVD